MLKQKPMVIWLTGLSGSGKTTLANEISNELKRNKYVTKLLDGDSIRRGINKELGFSDRDRHENIRRVAEISKLFIGCEIICVNAFITPTNEIREMVYEILGRENIFEIFVNAPLHVCEKRDTKGLYSKARKGYLKNFSGIDSPFEPPQNPNLEVNTDKQTVKQSIDICIPKILSLLNR